MINLLERLPATVEVEGEQVAINTDHSAWIKFTHFLKCGDEYPASSLCVVLEEERGIEPPLLLSLIRFMGEEFKYPHGATNKGSADTLDLFDDYPYIVALFRDRYSINLLTEQLHWYEFKALLYGALTPLDYIMGVRSDTSKERAAERAPWLIKKHVSKAEQTRKAELLEQLRGGGVKHGQ